MNIYFYAKSGHSIGLDSTKKCSAVLNDFKDYNPTLCTSDFRAGAFAKDNLGVKKYVNIDVMRNLTNIMQKNDVLFYLSDEVNEEMEKDIEQYCSFSYNLDFKDDSVIVDKEIYNKSNCEIKYEKTFFYGDDDYKNEFLNLVKDSNKYEINLLMGHYFFLGNEKIFKEHFTNIIDEEEYVDTIKQSKFLLTGSLQSALESISCGNNPVLIIRNDKQYNFDLIKNLNIPIVEICDINELVNKFESIINNYPLIKEPIYKDFSSIKDEISQRKKLFDKISNNY